MSITNDLSVLQQLMPANGGINIQSVKIGDLTSKGPAGDSVNALNTQTSFNSAQNINSVFGLTNAVNPFSNLGAFGQMALLGNFYNSPTQEPSLDSVLDAPDNAVLNGAAAPVDGAQDGAVAPADGSSDQQNGQNSGEQEMLAMMMMMMMMGGGMGGGMGMSGMGMLGMMGLGGMNSMGMNGMGGTGMDMSGMGAMGMGGGMGMMGGMGGGTGIQAAGDSMFAETASYFGEDSGENEEEYSEEEMG